jgi:hypothetical protein
MKIVRLIKMLLNETDSRVRIATHLADNFPIQNGLKQGDVLSRLVLNFALKYSIRKVQETPVGPILAYTDGNLLRDNTYTTKKNIDF